MIDADTFVKSILCCMWMLNDLPRHMRKDLDSQLGLIWLLLTEPKCFPSLQFTEEQQKKICEALQASSRTENFQFTYEALLNYEHRKVKEEVEEHEERSSNDDIVLVQKTDNDNNNDD